MRLLDFEVSERSRGRLPLQPSTALPS